MKLGLNRQALKESIGDTILATLINFPLIWALNYLTMVVFLFGPFGVSITNTFILFWIAVTRKYYVRIYFDKKNTKKEEWYKMNINGKTAWKAFFLWLLFVVIFYLQMHFQSCLLFHRSAVVMHL